MTTRTTFQSNRVLHVRRHQVPDVCWLVAYRGVWLRGERQRRGTQKGRVLIRQSPETFWTSIITVDPAEWAAGLAEDLRKFRQHPKHDKIAVELVQIVSLIPLHREATTAKRGLAAILTSTSEKPGELQAH